MLKRRSFLKGAAAGVATAAASTVAAPAIAKGRQEWRMSLTWPANTPGLGMVAQAVAKKIDLFTEGRIKIKVYGAGELMPAFQCWDAVAAGDIEMYQGADYYWQGKHPALNYFTTVPYGLYSTETYAWMYHGDGQELWDEVSGQFGVKSFLGNSTGTQMLGWFNKEVKSLDDFKGLRFRTVGIGGELYRRLGVAVVALPVAEIFPAIQSGTVDAVEWIGPWADMIFGLHKVAKYYYYPGVHEPGTTGSFGINRKLWDSLSNSDRLLIQTVIESEGLRGTAEYQARNAGALEELVAKHGVQLRGLSNQVLTELGKASAEVMAEIAEKDPLTRKVHESFLAFRKGQVSWTKVAEQAYLNARLLPFNYG